MLGLILVFKIFFSNETSILLGNNQHLNKQKIVKRAISALKRSEETGNDKTVVLSKHIEGSLLLEGDILNGDLSVVRGIHL